MLCTVVLSDNGLKSRGPSHGNCRDYVQVEVRVIFVTYMQVAITDCRAGRALRVLKPNIRGPSLTTYKQAIKMVSTMTVVGTELNNC
jgi:hypothetical protein